MQFRKFGRLDWKPSALGFGCMRLPLKGEKPKDIDEIETEKMLIYAIENGVNYLDTAYTYHGGESENFLGRFLKNGYRDRIKLATKLPSWLINSYADFDKYLNEQLINLKTEHIDFYLLHSLNRKSWSKIHNLGVLDWSEKAISDKRIGYLGFSFHDKYDAFKEIIDAYDHWTFCQIQYNYMDINNQAGTRGLRYAASKGLAVVIMEPILGGRLVEPPLSIKQLWDTSDTKRKPAEWALLWLWDQPEISLVLSGMSSMQHVIENVESADKSGISILNKTDLDLIDLVREKYVEISPIPCTKCDYCMPCPNGVNIPRNFEIFNSGIMYDKIDTSKVTYNNWFDEEERANNCQECYECEEKCPQKIKITEWLPKIHSELSY
jgi:predicted aldo/keto reductase-like oxidoreductase